MKKRKNFPFVIIFGGIFVFILIIVGIYIFSYNNQKNTGIEIDGISILSGETLDITHIYKSDYDPFQRVEMDSYGQVYYIYEEEGYDDREFSQENVQYFFDEATGYQYFENSVYNEDIYNENIYNENSPEYE